MTAGKGLTGITGKNHLPILIEALNGGAAVTACKDTWESKLAGLLRHWVMMGVHAGVYEKLLSQLGTCLSK